MDCETNTLTIGRTSHHNVPMKKINHLLVQFADPKKTPWAEPQWSSTTATDQTLKSVVDVVRPPWSSPTAHTPCL